MDAFVAWHRRNQERGALDEVEYDDEKLAAIIAEDFHEGEHDPASYPIPPGRSTEPVAGRNDPCPCGSGKKFKKCCLQ